MKCKFCKTECLSDEIENDVCLFCTSDIAAAAIANGYAVENGKVVIKPKEEPCQ